MIKLLHTADLHLDWTFPTFPASRRTLRRRELAGILYQVVSLALAHEVQALVIAGDLYESPSPPQEVRSAAVAAFMRLADHGIPVFLAPGHEEGPQGTLPRLDWPGNVCLLGGEEATASNLLCGLTVYGFPAGPWHGYRPLEGFRRLDRPGQHLGVLHGTYQGILGGAPEDLWPIHPDDIAHSGLDYLALGHYHDHLACEHGSTHAVYPGSPANLAFGQEPRRSVVLLTLGEGPPAIERLPVKDRTYLDLRFDLSATPFADALADLERRADPEACVQVTLYGAIGGELEFFADRLQERLAGAFFHLEAADRTEIALPDSAGTVEELFVRRCRAALAQPDLSPEERAVEEYTLRAGLVALRGGKL